MLLLIVNAISFAAFVWIHYTKHPTEGTSRQASPASCRLKCLSDPSVPSILSVIVAILLKTSPSKVRAMQKEGILRGVVLGKKMVRFRKVDLLALVAPT